MPIYEYQCTKCGNQTEIFQRISDPPVSKCELCKGKMKKLISQNTFHLKGSGWYVTDYASKSGGCDGKTTTSGDNNTAKETKEPAIEAKGSTDKTQKEATKTGSKKAEAKD
ncbi:MAG: zinc ribbon domain-containing protein [Deltaproteobacteria bacterium]|nr:zinc ribbon domain-containing protein [Deltaproteobacteria bacterium]